MILVKKKKEKGERGTSEAAQMSKPSQAARARCATQQHGVSLFFFSFYSLTCGSHCQVIVFKPGAKRHRTRRVDCVLFQFLVFHPELIPGDLRHHLTSRLFLLKLHTLLFVFPQTTRTESLQAARIWPCNSAVLPQCIVEFGELSPRFDL